MTVERLENEMSADELDDWIEFYNLEPFGDEERMADKRNALNCAISANTMGGESKPSDFEFYSNKNESHSSGLDLETMTDEDIKAAQSAVLLIMTAQ